MTEMNGYPASALADILFGLSTSPENLQKDDVAEPIPGSNLDEMLIFLARNHPEPDVINLRNTLRTIAVMTPTTPAQSATYCPIGLTN